MAPVRQRERSDEGTRTLSPWARLPKSCIECRRRKKPCEGGVPGCEACVQRGTVHLCRYGDHRDDTNLPESSYRQGKTSSAKATRAHEPVRNARHEDKVGSRSRRSTERVRESWTEDESDGGRVREPANRYRWRKKLERVRAHLPRRMQAERLIELHRNITFGGMLFLDDEHLVRAAYDNADIVNGTTPSAERHIDIWNVQEPILALILMICSSSLALLPVSLTCPVVRTLKIDDGTINGHDDLIGLWTQLALDFYDQSDLFRQPQLETVAGLTLYEFNLIGIGSQSRLIHHLDTAIRLSRVLGLDRIGSAEEDEERWNEIDARATSADAGSVRHIDGLWSDPQQPNGPNQGNSSTSLHLLSAVPLSTIAAGDWAARTFAERDHRRREIGRSIWWSLVLRDWNAGPQAGGSFNVYPGTFSTRYPSVYLEYTPAHSSSRCTHTGSNDVEARYDVSEQHRMQPWHFIASTSDIFRTFIDLCGTAASRNEGVRYEDILTLDKRVVALLDERPRWARAESGSIRWRFCEHNLSSVNEDVCGESVRLKATYVKGRQSTAESCCSAMNLISSTLWHKMFIIHRPFLSRALSDPETYGLSQKRTLNGALSLLEACNQYTDELNSTVMVFRLQHAAIALISLMLLQRIMHPHKHLHIAEENTSKSSDGLFNSLRIHKSLSFAIQVLKDIEQRTSLMKIRAGSLIFKDKTTDGHDRAQSARTKSIFFGLSGALERLLQALARMALPPPTRRSEQDRSAPSRHLPSGARSALVGSNANGSVAEGTDANSSFRPLSLMSTEHDDPTHTPSTSSIQGHVPATPEVPFESISQLDRDLFRLLDNGADDFFSPPQHKAAATPQSWDQSLSEAPFANYTQATAWQNSSNAPSSSIPPAKPPWITSDLWQSIFDILNNRQEGGVPSY